jgi:hypothetical protein
VSHSKEATQIKDVREQVAGSKKAEVTGRWRRLHNEDVHNLYSSPNIIRIIKSRRMRLGKREMHTKYAW